MAKRSKMLRVSHNTLGEESRRIAVYVRVSTDRQAEEGYSIEIQKERLSAYVVSMFGRDAQFELYLDDGYSGASLDRPGIQRLILDANERRVTHVIVYKLDRLSRSQKDTLYLIEDVFLLHDVEFISMLESFNTGTPFGRAVIGILSVFAQLERENIFERTRSGMQKRVESGLWMGGGRVPFGYDYDKERGILTPNADADRVRAVYDLYIKGYSLQRIADMLHLKYEKLAHQILTRKSNTGVIVYNGSEYPGQHEPIVSPETYETAMRLLRERSQRRLTATTDHLLTGLVYCGYCGSKMRYQKWGKAGYKLVCYSQQTTKKYLIKDENCPNKRAWADEIEDAAIRDLFRFTKRHMNAEADGDGQADMLELLRGQQAATAQKLKRLYTLYAEDGNETLLETIGELRADLERIGQKISEEEERNVWSRSAAQTKAELENLEDAWPHMTKQERQNAIRSVLERVTVKDDSARIDYKL